MNAFKPKAKQCCEAEHERVARKVGACEMESDTLDEKHACYRRVAKAGGRRARACISGA